METKMEIHSGAPITKRARLAPPATPSSGGLAVAVGSGEGAPTGSEDQEEEFGLDRISDLPDAILGEIISYLPTKEGIRTQILTRRWRPVWRTAPLNLDCHEIPVGRLFNALETVHIEIISRASAYSEELVRIRYIGTWHRGKTVPHDDSYLPESILSGHDGAVHRLCIPACYLQCRPSTVHAWLESSRLNNLQVLEFYYLFPRFVEQTVKLPHTCSSSMPSLPTSISRFSCSLHTVSFAYCQIPDHYVRALELPLVKRLSLVEVDISDFSLESIINSSCPALECLLLVCNRERQRITINSPNLVSIGIRGEKGKFIIEDAPSLQRLIHDIQSNNMEVFIVSARKLEILGKFRISLDSTGLMDLATDSLTTMCQSVKTLLLIMSYKVDLVVHLIQCLPNLENLFVEGGFVADGARNIWRRKHRAFVKEHNIHLKTITLEDYERSGKNIEFVRFFILNATELETIMIKFRFPSNFTLEFYEQQQKLFLWENKASKRAHLKLSACCDHACLDLKHRRVEYLDLSDPFTCDCWKQGCS